MAFLTTSPSIHLRAPAKVNWALEVLNRRNDGYHQIETVMQCISLADELFCRRTDTPQCVIHCNDPSIPLGEENLIAHAWRVMRWTFPDRVQGLEVQLDKKIPAGAGLGGGSSDAAAALMAINSLYDLRLNRARISTIAASIGSDVPFFIYGGAALATGRGEIVEPLRSRLPLIYMIVIYPGFASLTAKAYSHLNPTDFRPFPSPDTSITDQCVQAVTEGRKDLMIDSLYNTFDAVLTREDLRYAPIKEQMLVTGLQRPMISGSGSACFGLAADRAVAYRVWKDLQKYYPYCWVVRTLQSGVKRII